MSAAILARMDRQEAESEWINANICRAQTVADVSEWIGQTEFLRQHDNWSDWWTVDGIEYRTCRDCARVQYEDEDSNHCPHCGFGANDE